MCSKCEIVSWVQQCWAGGTANPWAWPALEALVHSRFILWKVCIFLATPSCLHNLRQFFYPQRRYAPCSGHKMEHEIESLFGKKPVILSGSLGSFPHCGVPFRIITHLSWFFLEDEIDQVDLIFFS